jgi:hypothetical protein
VSSSQAIPSVNEIEKENNEKHQTTTTRTAAAAAAEDDGEGEVEEEEEEEWEKLLDKSDDYLHQGLVNEVDRLTRTSVTR